MKNNFHFETKFNKIYLASATRMLLMRGEGELEIKSQGRFKSSLSFSQETGVKGQQAPWNGDQRPKLERELSARMRVNSGSSPQFFSLQESQFFSFRENQRSSAVEEPSFKSRRIQMSSMGS